MMGGNALVGAGLAAAGLLVLVLGYFVRFRGRVDLLASYDGGADPRRTAVRAGTPTLFTGGVLVATGVAEATVGLPVAGYAVATLGVVVLGFLTTVRAAGA